MVLQQLWNNVQEKKFHREKDFKNINPLSKDINQGTAYYTRTVIHISLVPYLGTLMGNLMARKSLLWDVWTKKY